MIATLLFLFILRADFYDQHFGCIQSRQFLFENQQQGLGECLTELRQSWQSLKKPNDLENAFLLFQRHDPGYDLIPLIELSLNQQAPIVCSRDYFHDWFLLRLVESPGSQTQLKKLIAKCSSKDEAILYPLIQKAKDREVLEQLCTLLPKAKDCKK